MVEKDSVKHPALSKVLYGVVVLLAACATIGVLAIWRTIMVHKAEAKQTIFQIVKLDETVDDPAEWGKNYPRQYDSYRRTVDIERTRYGGSEAFQRLDAEPNWRVIFQGYAFGVDYREERGHAYMLSDQEETERVKKFKQPGSCLHCHASVIPAYRELGCQAGASPQDAVMKGFERLCSMPYAEARNVMDSKGKKLIQHPVTCLDCHNPASMQLRVTRPGLLNALPELAKSETPLPHLPSIMRWRAGKRAQPYDVNAEASRQEMRTMVCAQCHVEYYFKGTEKKVTYPWQNGLQAEQIEAYYDQVGHVDWTHATSGAKVLKAQHPEFELWSQGIHARSGVSCADCHMPYVREGAIKVSDHHIRSPLLAPARSCQVCHRYSEKEILARAETIQTKTQMLMKRAEAATVGLIQALAELKKAGASDALLNEARGFQRQAQWRLDFVAAENSMGFHAPQESARLLAEAIDLAHRGRLSISSPVPVQQ